MTLKSLLRTSLTGFFLLLAAVLTDAPASASGGGKTTECTPKNLPEIASHKWSFQGIFGHYDHESALRGFEVYKGVCSSCHSLNLFAFRNLAALGATEDEIKGVAQEFEVPADPNDAGEIVLRKALPSDHFPKPFPNSKAAAAANGGAIPPDLSLIVKARPDFEAHVPKILGGYMSPPEGCHIPEGRYYNAYFPGYQISMAPPLTADAVTYNDGTAATVEQMTVDINNFLAFVAEPKLEERKQTGLKVLIFLIILTVLLYLAKREVWRKVH
jgi:ubiquinol-cytochrome c reductase cytochrome c1 subunit